MHRSADYSSFKAAHHGEVRPTRWEIRPMAEKCASKSWATFLHTHQIEHKKQKQLKWWFQQAFICIWVCFSVTGSELKLSFLKENLPSPKYGIHLHCNPKWRAGSFPLDLCFTYSYSLVSHGQWMETLPCTNSNRPLWDRCSGNHWQAAFPWEAHHTLPQPFRSKLCSCPCPALIWPMRSYVSVQSRSDRYLYFNNFFSMFPFPNTFLNRQSPYKAYFSKVIIICYRINSGISQACLCKNQVWSNPFVQRFLSGSVKENELL